MNENEIYVKAIEKWGRDPQEDVMIEEMAELTKAILKYRRHERYDCPVLERTDEWYLKHKELLNNLLEEMADVYIMLNQMKLLHNNGLYDNYIRKKLKRTAERLGLKGDLKNGTHKTITSL